jgi:hypothetical protein
MWQASTSKAVAPTCISKGPMGSPPQPSIEHTDRMLVFMGSVSLVVECQHKLDFFSLLQWLTRERS